MRILVVDQCSRDKAYPDDSSVCDIEMIDEHSLGDLLDRPVLPGIEARDLYTGRQQRHVSKAIRILRTADIGVDRVFVSAGFGVVEEDTRLPPYDVTFKEMNQEEIAARSRQLGISNDVIEFLTEAPPYDIVFLPLGADYYSALDIDRLIAARHHLTTLVLFNRGSLAEEHPNVVSIPARTKEAKEYGEITIALKGEYLRRFARQAVKSQPSTPQGIVEYCQADPTVQSGLDNV
jgi:hypothetical protein